jgi:hypothetical protein
MNSCERGNELLRSRISEEFLDMLSDYYLLKKNSAP